MTTQPSEPDQEAGSSTIALAGIVAAVLVLAALLISVVSVFTHRAQLQAVADMAALTGADSVPVSALLIGEASSVGCESAIRVGVENNASVDSCEEGSVFSAGDIRVVVSRNVSVMGLSVTVRANARAGPQVSPMLLESGLPEGEEGQ